MRVKPVDPTAVIRDPHTMRTLPAEGDDVPDNSFWRRRLLDGEIELLEDEQPALERGKPSTHPIGNQPMRAPAPRDIAADRESEQPVRNEPVAPLTTRNPRS